MARISGFCSAACAASVFGWAASGAVVYVDDSASAGQNNGASWANAYLDLQDALGSVGDGDEVRIAQGIYKPTPPQGDRNATFTLINGVVVQGGYAGFGAPDPDALDPSAFPTTLSGDLNGDDQPDFINYEENSLHVVTATGLTPSAQLRGVTISGGSAVNGHEILYGGGILCVNSTLVISDSFLQDNQAYMAAGALYASNLDNDASQVHAQACIIRRNHNVTSVGGAGGVLAGPGSTFLDCRFESNNAVVASSGGAISAFQTEFESCQFIDNHAGEDGGAVTGSDLTFTDCQFSQNSCSVFGGAVLGGPHTFMNCTFSQNNSGEQGGAARGSSLQFQNCIFDSNGSGSGGALHLQQNCSAIQCAFIGNQTPFPAGSQDGGAIRNNGTLDLINCGFRANTADGPGSAVRNAGTLTAVNCLFNGNVTPSSGAMFVNDSPGASASAMFINCTLVGNASSAGGSIPGAAILNTAGNQLTIRNSILWDNYPLGGAGNQGSQLLNNGGSISIDNSTVQGWNDSLGGVGNSGDDPLLIDANGADNQYGTEDDNPRLSGSSPCRDEGNTLFLPPDSFDLDHDGDTTERIALDLDSLARIISDIVDRGSFEFPQPGCPADVSGGEGGQTNSGDLLALLNAWGQCSDSDCPADITNDGIVDGLDLAFVFAHWGACP